LSLSGGGPGRGRLTPRRIGVPASLSENRLCLRSQVLRRIHVLADASRKMAVDVLLTNQLVKSLAFSRLFEGAF
jgi:hypothetical protein